jgi:hypothetical protein
MQRPQFLALNLLFTHRAPLFRSVHNTRIERLWVDYTVQLGSKWADFFTDLELHHLFDADNPNHIWLLQFLFLLDLNEEIALFAETWNNHLLRHDGERARSPLDRFQWDMQVRGMRGDLLLAGLSIFVCLHRPH